MVLSPRSGRRDSPMTRGLAIPPPARPPWLDATLYEVRPHQESCIMVPRSGDPLQERSGRLEKMSFAAPWRTVDNIDLHGGRQARTVASRRAPLPSPRAPMPASSYTERPKSTCTSPESGSRSRCSRTSPPRHRSRPPKDRRAGTRSHGDVPPHQDLSSLCGA